MNDLTVVIPVHKEDPSLVTKTYTELHALGCEVIVVDDGNTMDLDIPHLTYPGHVGYGYAIKHGVKHSTRPITLSMDGDSQHLVDDVKKLYTVYKLIDNCKMVVGQRWNLAESGHRKWGRKILNFIASCIAGHHMPDLNSGMRIFDTDMVRGYSPILCDTFSFTTSLTVAVVTDKHKMAYFPINVQPRASGKSHVKVVKDGFITLWYICTIGIALRTRKLRAKIRGR